VSYPHHPPIRGDTGRRVVPAAGLLFVATILLATAPGCAPRPKMLPAAERTPIDRSIIEGPTGYTVERYIENLTAATSIAFDDRGNLLIAEAGIDGHSPAVYGFRPNGSRFDIYRDPRLPFGIGSPKAKLYGPIGGMVYHEGKVYVSHRDANRKGVISALGYDGSRKTIVAGMPAQGDYGLTDLAVSADGRLYFGIGTATNSGVVGLDNWASGWVRRYPKVKDLPWTKLRLRGVRMDSRNPLAGLFGPGEKAVTGAFQPFDTANKSWVYPPQNGKFNGAIYSVAFDGGDLRPEAWGIRLPRGLAFNPSGLTLYFTNNGMELRGSRPVRDDPDVLCKLVRKMWYGWPDYSADFYDITLPRYQPPTDLLFNTGYDALPALVDQTSSGPEGKGLPPPPRDALLHGTFPSQSGAAKLVMVPGTGPFEKYQGSAFVALGGDRAPFATGNRKTIGPIGYKVVRVVVDNQQVEDFVRNTRGVPAHRHSKPIRHQAFERPVDVKFGPDGALYILDMGRMQVKNGKERIYSGTGQVFRVVPIDQAQPPTQPAGESVDDGDDGDAPDTGDVPPDMPPGAPQ
jgi:glucose/arabinose dehydrogenase